MKPEVMDNVWGLLSRHDMTRDSDNELIYWYIVDVCGIPMNRKLFRKMPNFESITRARRKIQTKNNFPADIITQRHRNINRDEYRKWSIK